MTYPHIGNVGANLDDEESSRPYIESLIVREFSQVTSNWRSAESAQLYLNRHKLPVIWDIDTRALVRHIRKEGALRGMVSTDGTPADQLVHEAKQLPSMAGQELASRVSTAKSYGWESGSIELATQPWTQEMSEAGAKSDTRKPLLGLSLLTSPAVAADPWRLPDWSARAVVEIPTPSTEQGVDAAGVKILCQGRANPTAPTTASSTPTVSRSPSSSISTTPTIIRCSPSRLITQNRGFTSTLAIPRPPAPEQTADSPAPGGGPPAGGWVPHSDFVYQTIDRPRAADLAKEHDPDNIEEMTKLIAGSKAKFGARWQRRVADGYDPFGPSDYYISIYRGWVRCPRRGRTSSAPSPTRRRSRSWTANRSSTGPDSTPSSAASTARSTPRSS